MRFPMASAGLTAFATFSQAYQMMVYDSNVETDCNATSETDYRYYEGDASGLCQPLGQAASGSNGSHTCQEYFDGGTSNGDCSEDVWEAASLIVYIDNDIYYCNVFSDEECEDDRRSVDVVSQEGDERAGKCAEFSGGFKSFQCMYKNDTTTDTSSEDTEDSESSGYTLDAWKSDWRDMKCDVGPMTNDATDPQEKWDYSGASAAWTDMIHQWVNCSESYGSDEVSNIDCDQSLSNFVSNYFRQRPFPDCGDPESNNCGTGVKCSDMDSPAAYMIFNSMVNLWSPFNQFVSAINAAQVDMGAEIGKLQEDFREITQDDQNASIMEALNILFLVFGVGMGTVFSAFLRRNTWTSKSSSGERSAYAAHTGLFLGLFGINMGRDALDAPEALDVQNGLEQYQLNLTNALGNLTRETAYDLFNPSEDWTPLFDSIEGGRAFSADVQNGDQGWEDLDVVEPVKRLLYMHMITDLWKPGGADGSVVILTDDDVRLDDDYSGCDAKISPFPEWQKDLDNYARVCDGEDVYWIVIASNAICRPGDKRSLEGSTLGRRQAYTFPGAACDTQTGADFAMPEGADSIDGTNWGGLEMKTFVMNAVNSWKDHGKTNGWDQPDLSETDNTDWLEVTEFDKLPGLVNIPVCSRAEVQEVLKEDQENENDSPTWPCKSTA